MAGPAQDVLPTVNEEVTKRTTPLSGRPASTLPRHGSGQLRLPAPVTGGHFEAGWS